MQVTAILGSVTPPGRLHRAVAEAAAQSDRRRGQPDRAAVGDVPSAVSSGYTSASGGAITE
jgi:hypothetical protein